MPISQIQEERWEAQLKELAAYKDIHGDCNVPQGWEERPELAAWVKRQREARKTGTLGESRTKKLDELEFEWGTSQEERWEAQLKELAAYKDIHGDCNVPQGWEERPELAAWVHTQRVARKTGKMKASRKKKLDELEFEWAIILTPAKRQAGGTAGKSGKKFKIGKPQGTPQSSSFGVEVRNLRLPGPRGEGFATVDGRPVMGLGQAAFQFSNPFTGEVLSRGELEAGGRWLLGVVKLLVEAGVTGIGPVLMTTRNGAAFTLDSRDPEWSLEVLSGILFEALDQAAKGIDDAKPAVVLLLMFKGVFERRQQEGGWGSESGRYLEVSYYEAPGSCHQDNPANLADIGGAYVLAVEGGGPAPPLTFKKKGEVVGDVMRDIGIGFVGSPMLLSNASRSDGNEFGLSHQATGMVPSPTAVGAEFRRALTLIVRFDYADVPAGLRILPVT